MGGGILISLTACSENAFDDANQLTEENSMYTTNSFNDADSGNTHGNPGGSGPISRGIDYYSPWDMWWRVNPYGDLQPVYIMNNSFPGSEKEFQTSNYKIEVYAYVGLAYFDDINNGTYNDHKTGLTFNLANGNYPTLYANGNEVGNLVKTSVPFKLNPGDGIRVEDRTQHLLYPTNLGGIERYPGASNGQNFIFNNLTTQEEDLLATYGKVFFYEVIVHDASTGGLVAHDYMHIKTTTLPSFPQGPNDPPFNPDWNPVNDLTGNQIQGIAPGGIGTIPLYYLYKGIPGGTIWNYLIKYTNQCDSREVVFDLPLVMNTLPLQGTDYLELDIVGSTDYGWLNASLHLQLH